VLLDEAYCEYSEAQDFPVALELLSRYPNLIITRTFSKIFGLAGLRVGYGMAHPEIIKNMNKMRAPFNVNSMAQIAAAAALSDTDFVARSRHNNREGKALYYQELARMGLRYYPTEGNFILVQLPVSGSMVAARLSDQGVLVRSTAGFGLENAIRITIGTPAENRIVLKHLESIMCEKTA
jgi:histidinol-phosphate aminotransferase